ncbi:MAG TPA: flavodoxin-dependent (E)-4-hydroxy-3-methylbut-2-enyl-diphosphate synthase, partial [Cytophagaceae bacterium]
MKASNTRVMVQAYRLLVQKLKEESLKPYPLHLGVTEAGEGEDGRIKSAVGIGALLEDGLGDTVRVSLTEDPEFEAPVARMLIDRYTTRESHGEIPSVDPIPVDPFQYHRRQSFEVHNIGGANVPRVIVDFSKVSLVEMQDLKAIGHFYMPLLDKWSMNDLGADYIYSGKRPIPFMLPNGIKEILDYEVWLTQPDKENTVPLLNASHLIDNLEKHAELNFLKIDLQTLLNLDVDILRTLLNIVLIIDTYNLHAMAELRRLFFELMNKDLKCPVIIMRKYPSMDEEKLQLYAATDCGSLLIDGLGDGVLLSTDLIGEVEKKPLLQTIKNFNNTSFGILQAARTRMSKTEYISCPSCGRTLFDLQETTAMIRKRTDHLKGIKIGIMGCIVNGPGEMADADYGYVGVGKGKIALYRGQTVVKKAVPSDNAVDELIQIIREDGNWLEPLVVIE